MTEQAQSNHVDYQAGARPNSAGTGECEGGREGGFQNLAAGESWQAEEELCGLRQVKHGPQDGASIHGGFQGSERLGRGGLRLPGAPPALRPPGGAASAPEQAGAAPRAGGAAPAGTDPIAV